MIRTFSTARLSRARPQSSSGETWFRLGDRDLATNIERTHRLRAGESLFRDLVTGKAGDELLFVRHDGQPWGKNHHVRPLAEACRAAEVSPVIAFHELRHTYASHLAQAGVDLLTISRLLGHSDTRTTSKHYAHLSDKTLAHAVTKLPSFGGERKSKPRAVGTQRKAVRDPARPSRGRTGS